MNTLRLQSPSKIRQHRFFIVAAPILASDLLVPRLDHWSNPSLLEAGVLFDVSILIPALYLICYRSRGKAAVLRAIALACLGIWVAGHIVPTEYHQILSSVGVVRYIGLAVLLAIELKLALVIYRSVFQGGADAAADAQRAASDAGMPEWVARLMAFEAGLWRKTWEFFQRLFRRGT